MSLYAIGQRVWCKSQNSLGIVTEARYTGMPRKAEYVIDLGSGTQRFTGRTDRFGNAEFEHERLGRDYMTGSRDLRAADWGCDGCDRWLPGQPHATAPDGEYPNGLHFCFLCSSPQVIGTTTPY
jgi:hypothetical protein